MLLGLPQMQGPELADTLAGPLVLELSGPGGGVWRIFRPEPEGPLTVVEGTGAGTVVRSDAHTFIAWGTKRWDWRRDCEVDGEEAVASKFLDALNII
jgi:hypothetical protein